MKNRAVNAPLMAIGFRNLVKKRGKKDQTLAPQAG
jgi:hypothetical protein